MPEFANPYAALGQGLMQGFQTGQQLGLQRQQIQRQAQQDEIEREEKAFKKEAQNVNDTVAMLKYYPSAKKVEVLNEVVVPYFQKRGHSIGEFIDYTPEVDNALKRLVELSNDSKAPKGTDAYNQASASIFQELNRLSGGSSELYPQIREATEIWKAMPDLKAPTSHHEELTRVNPQTKKTEVKQFNLADPNQFNEANTGGWEKRYKEPTGDSEKATSVISAFNAERASAMQKIKTWFTLDEQLQARNMDDASVLSLFMTSKFGKAVPPEVKASILGDLDEIDKRYIPIIRGKVGVPPRNTPLSTPRVNPQTIRYDTTGKRQ
jgi:hypothetical protein